MKKNSKRSEDAADLRRKAEALARKQVDRTSKEIASLSPEEIGKILHELRVHQIELEMQNEELRTAQAEIEEMRARYFDLYDLAPVGYITVSEKGLILEANLTAVSQLGVNRGELPKRPLTRFILKEDQDIYYLHRKELFESGEPQLCELRLAGPDGVAFWARLQATFAKGPDGEPLCRVAISDISEYKRAEEKLRQSEERFRALHNASFGGIAIHDKGLILECNQGLSELTGYSLDELIGMDALLLIAPETRDQVTNNILAGYEKTYEAVGLRKNGELYPVRLEARNIPYKGKTVRTVEFRDLTESKQAQEALHRIEWMLSRKSAELTGDYDQPYGDLSELNTNRLIYDSVGRKFLKNIANDFMKLLESSSAVYEKNGDYALGLFASGWCRFMDQASRELCDTNDNKEALDCGKWICHDCCWKEASQPAIASGRPVDIECQGGIRLYALPIVAGDEVIGAINFGYGDPPRDREKLSELAEKYKVPLDELTKKAKEYQSRPSFIIETAKDRLQTSAHLIGEIVRRKITEKEILSLNKQLERKVAEKTRELRERIDALERFHDATIEREFRVKELRDEIERLKSRDKK